MHDREGDDTRAGLAGYVLMHTRGPTALRVGARCCHAGHKPRSALTVRLDAMHTRANHMHDREGDDTRAGRQLAGTQHTQGHNEGESWRYPHHGRRSASGSGSGSGLDLVGGHEDGFGGGGLQIRSIELSTTPKKHRQNWYRLSGMGRVIIAGCRCRGIKRLVLPPVLQGGRGITRVVWVQALHVLRVCL